jgi:hypothetical protein
VHTASLEPHGSIMHGDHRAEASRHSFELEGWVGQGGGILLPREGEGGAQRWSWAWEESLGEGLAAMSVRDGCLLLALAPCADSGYVASSKGPSPDAIRNVEAGKERF